MRNRPQPTLEQLVVRARGGDRRAAADLAGRMRPQARRLAATVVGDPKLAARVAKMAVRQALADHDRPYPAALVATTQRLGRNARLSLAPDRSAPLASRAEQLERTVLVLCDEENHTHRSAAELLDLPVAEVARLHASGRRSLGLEPMRETCRGWHLVARAERLQGPERELADKHVALCRSCRTELAARAEARARLRVLLPAGGVTAGGVVAVAAAALRGKAVTALGAGANAGGSVAGAVAGVAAAATVATVAAVAGVPAVLQTAGEQVVAAVPGAERVLGVGEAATDSVVARAADDDRGADPDSTADEAVGDDAPGSPAPSGAKTATAPLGYPFVPLAGTAAGGLPLAGDEPLRDAGLPVLPQDGLATNAPSPGELLPGGLLPGVPVPSTTSVPTVPIEPAPLPGVTVPTVPIEPAPLPGVTVPTVPLEPAPLPTTTVPLPTTTVPLPTTTVPLPTTTVPLPTATEPLPAAPVTAPSVPGTSLLP